MTHTIQHDELPARLRMLATEMEAVGNACAYFGGFNSPLTEYGRMLSDQSALVARDIAAMMESLMGGRA